MGGCGDSYQRVINVDLDLDLDLDKRKYIDAGIRSGGPTAPPGVRSAPFGPKLHVTHEDPAVIVVNASACSGYHEWGVQITYATGGKTYTKVIGDSTHPFRTVGKPKSPLTVCSRQGGDLNKLNRVDTSTSPGTASDTSETDFTRGGSDI